MTTYCLYNQLRKQGMSASGAIAMLGNMSAESSLRPDNLQDSYAKAWGITDTEYCALVNTGKPTHNGKTFWEDGAGFGLCQWTSSDRKRGLYAVAVEQWGSTIEDSEAQVWFCCYELRERHRELWNYLTSPGCDLYTAVSRICKEYERPAINNIDDRYKRAIELAEEIAHMTLNDVKPAAPAQSPQITVDYRVEIATVLEHIAAILRREAADG